MSTDLDTTRIVRSWLRTDEHESADRVLDTVLALLDATPQHRSQWPVRRFAEMNSYAKLLIAAAAVLVVAIVGYNLLPVSRSGVGGPVTSPAATSSASPSPRQSPESTAWPRGTLQEQRYHVVGSGVPFSFALPLVRWRSGEGGHAIQTGIDHDPGVPEDGFAWMVFPDELMHSGDIVNIATNACAGQSRRVEAPSIDAHASALTTVSGTSAEDPVDVTIGGLPAKLVVYTIDPYPQCDAHTFWLYGVGSLYPNKVTSIIKTWITEVDGRRFVIHTDQSAPDSNNEREIQQIVDSIEFE